MKIDLSGEDWAEIERQIEQASGAAFAIPDREAPALFETIELEVRVDGRLQGTASGRVVQYFEHTQTVALTFEEDDAAKLLRGGRTAARAVVQSDEPVWKRFEGMTRAEKIRLAKSGNAAERRQVLKDRDGSLHVHVLNNKGLKPKELAQLIRTGGVSASFLKKVAERSEFLGNRAVAEALVLNPLTPVALAVRLVDRIPIQTARRIARTGSARMPVLAAIKKRVVK